MPCCQTRRKTRIIVSSDSDSDTTVDNQTDTASGNCSNKGCRTPRTETITRRLASRSAAKEDDAAVVSEAPEKSCTAEKETLGNEKEPERRARRRMQRPTEPRQKIPKLNQKIGTSASTQSTDQEQICLKGRDESAWNFEIEGAELGSSAVDTHRVQPKKPARNRAKKLDDKVAAPKFIRGSSRPDLDPPQLPKRAIADVINLDSDEETFQEMSSQKCQSPPKRRKLESTNPKKQSKLDFSTLASAQHWVIPDGEAVKYQETQLWVDKYEPLSELEIAVNNKKVAEVRTWLDGALSWTEQKHQVRSQQTKKLLVLSGPSGAGKTATLRMLSKELDFEILEWSNPINTNLMNAGDDDHPPADGGGWYPSGYMSMVRQFQDFLASASKTPALTFVNTTTTSAIMRDSLPRTAKERKVILVEDVPNVGHTSTRSAIHTAIRTYVRSPRSRYPLVFIITETSTLDVGEDNRRNGRDGVLSIRTLIPGDVAASHLYTQISFNPIAPTYLIKALSRISHLEFRSPSRSSSGPDKATIDSIARSSGGDIRCALNALQFLTLRDIGNSEENIKPIKAGRGRKKAVATKKKKVGPRESAQLDYVGCREINLSLFHSLGKILYNKREDDDTENTTSAPLTPSQSALPVHLQGHERERTKSNPEEVFERSHLDAEMFSLFLHENCLPFFADIDEVVTSSAYLSAADVLAGNWQYQPQLSEYMASVTSRGLMFAHTLPVPPQQFRQMYRPAIWTATKRCRELQAGIREAVTNWIRAGFADKETTEMKLAVHYPEAALSSEVLPYLAMMIRPSQGRIGAFARQQYRYQAQANRMGGQYNSQQNNTLHPLTHSIAIHHRRLLESLCDFRSGAFNQYNRGFGEKDIHVELDDEEKATAKHVTAAPTNAELGRNSIKQELEDDIIDDW